MSIATKPLQALFCLSVVLGPLVWAGPITISEDQVIDFGYTYQGANACDVDFNNNISGDCLGVGSSGVILINGDPNTSLIVSVATLGWIGDLKVTPEMPRKYPTVLNNQGILTVPIAAKLQMRGSPGGVFTIQYAITVNYQ